jgi:ribosomal protein S27E
LSLLRLYRDPETRVFFYKTKCDCGKETFINSNAIMQGGQMFCSNDCYIKIKHINSVRRYDGKEGYAITYKKLKKSGKLPDGLKLKETLRLVSIWLMMLKRCGHRGTTPEKNYQGRGIKVAQEWRRDPWPFILHIGPRPSKKHSLDRIDNEGHYKPGNVKWSTATEQAKNSRKHLDATKNDFKKIFSYRGEFNSRVTALYTHKGIASIWRIKCGVCGSKRYLRRFSATKMYVFVRACKCANPAGKTASGSLRKVVEEMNLDIKDVKKYACQ